MAATFVCRQSSSTDLSWRDLYNHANNNLAIYSHETSQDKLSEA